MERKYGCCYVPFEAILGFTENEQMGCLEAFRYNANCTKHPRNFSSHIGTPRSVSEENMTKPGEVQKRPKNNQN